MTVSVPNLYFTYYLSNQKLLRSFQRIVKTRAPKCVTRDGDAGRCVDLGDCPILLVNPDGLRKSICVQKLIPFSPGVCCPNNG